jgi:hypothetical protein
MKSLYIFIAVTTLQFTTFSYTFAQDKRTTINGKVISFEESFPLEGITIAIKGTSNRTVTQADGRFSLAITQADKTLVISSNEYQTIEIAIVTNKISYEIALQRKVNSPAGVKNSLLSSIKLNKTFRVMAGNIGK